MIRYIESIDISFPISIYRIVSYRQNNIEFFDIPPEVYTFITPLPK